MASSCFWLIIMRLISVFNLRIFNFSGVSPMAPSDTDSATATVTVNQYVSITLTDYGTSGLDFESLDPNTSNNPEKEQGASTGAVKVKNDDVSNVQVNLYVMADQFCTDYSTCSGISPEYKFAVTNVKYHTSDASGSATAFTTANTYVDTLVDLAVGGSQDLWYWIDIPGGQVADVYNSSFGFKGDTA